MYGVWSPCWYIRSLDLFSCLRCALVFFSCFLGPRACFSGALNLGCSLDLCAGIKDVFKLICEREMCASQSSDVVGGGLLKTIGALVLVHSNVYVLIK